MTCLIGLFFEPVAHARPPGDGVVVAPSAGVAVTAAMLPASVATSVASAHLPMSPSSFVPPTATG